MSNIESFQSFQLLSSGFEQYHKVPLNVILHFITSPLGIIGLLGFIRKLTNSSALLLSLIYLYLTSLIPFLSNGVYFGTLIISIFITFLVLKLRLSYISSSTMLILGYILQDMAHALTGEKTFQSTYSSNSLQVKHFMCSCKCEYNFYI
jgi:hypothetical protein